MLLSIPKDMCPLNCFLARANCAADKPLSHNRSISFLARRMALSIFLGSVPKYTHQKPVSEKEV